MGYMQDVFRLDNYYPRSEVHTAQAIVHTLVEVMRESGRDVFPSDGGFGCRLMLVTGTDRQHVMQGYTASVCRELCCTYNAAHRTDRQLDNGTRLEYEAI